MEGIQTRPKLIGYLMIHVSGYKQISSGTSHMFSDGRVISDRQMPVPGRTVDSMLWWEEGWAVGDNPRDRFCKWLGGAKIRRYTDFDEATAIVRHLEKTRKKPHEAYTLVYGHTQSDGRERLWPVYTLDDIERIDSQLAIELADAQKRLQALKAETPGIDELMKHYTPSRALILSMLLKSIKENGRDSVPEGMSRSTFYKQVRELKIVGLVE